jgi:hypothetical protein
MVCVGGMEYVESRYWPGSGVSRSREVIDCASGLGVIETLVPPLTVSFAAVAVGPLLYRTGNEAGFPLPARGFLSIVDMREKFGGAYEDVRGEVERCSVPRC